MMRRFLLIVVTLVSVAAGKAYGIDHKNLDENRPLRLEDAYPIATDEIAIEAGGGVAIQRNGESRGVFPIEVLYGALPNLQVGIGTTLLTDPREVDEVKSGDLKLSGLYNFNQETLTLPALGLKLTVGFPTGVDSSGVDVELKGLVTKSVDRLSFHLNAAYTFLNGTRPDERDGRYQFVIGASYPVGAPRYTRTTLVGDLFLQHATERGRPDIFGAEIGFRHQLTSRIVLDAGIGTELAGPGDRLPFFFTTGFSIGF